MQELKRKENKRHFNRYTNKNDFGNCQSSGMREYISQTRNLCGWYMNAKDFFVMVRNKMDHCGY